MHHAVYFLCLNDGVGMAWALAIHLNILDLHLHSRNYLCLNGIHDVILNQRRSSRKLKVPILLSLGSFSLGASVFIGVYLRKPTSKEGNRVYLTRGNLNGERGKTEETVPVRQRRKPTKLYRHEGFDLAVSLMKHDSFVKSSYSYGQRGVGRMFCRFWANMTVRRTSFWFIVTPFEKVFTSRCWEKC